MRRELLRAASLVCFVLLSCLSTDLMAQHVVKIAMPKVKAATATPTKKPAAVIVPQKKVPDTVAQKTILYNSFLKLNRKDLLARNPNVKLDTIAVPNDSVLVVDSVALAKAVKDSTDAAAAAAGAASNDTTTAPTTGNCVKLKDVNNLDLNKTVNGDYVFSLVDNKNNPLSTFTLKQFNESLFTDQLRKALSGLCTTSPLPKDDSLYVEGLIAAFTQQKLYDKMLEASLEVNDAAVYAGELKVYKTMPVTFEYDKDQLNALRDTVLARAKKMQKAPTNAAKGAVRDTARMQKTEGRTGTQSDAAVKLRETSPAPVDTVADDVAGKLDSLSPSHKDFTAYSISIQFQDGFIENIKVLGKVAGNKRTLKFENVFPIPFSTKRDFKVLYRTDLLERTIYNYSTKNDSAVSTCRLNLGDLLFYSQQLAVDNKDYSPKNQVYNAILTDTETVINLEKEQTSKIMELRVFSDLKGIDDNSPNGLIQLELIKKLNFWSNRHPGWGNHFNFGFLNYVMPSFTMNKIEDKNRRLVANYLGSRQGDTTRANTFASTLDLYQYQSFGIGVNLTCFTMDIPAWKSTVNFNIGAYFGRSQIQDTTRTLTADSSRFVAAADNNVTHFGVNSFRLVPEVCWQVFPDPRYGFILSQKFIHYSMQSTDLRQVRDSLSYGRYLTSLHGDRSKIDAYSFQKWIGSAEIYAYFKPAEYNQVFFRYRYNWDMSNAKLNFQQVQIGISTYLTHTKEEKTKTTP